MKVLLCFVSCQKRIDSHQSMIADQMTNLQSQDYILVTGGHSKTEFIPSQKRLLLECNDYYEGLPEKVLKMFSWLSQSPDFLDYQYFCKLDEDMQVHRIPQSHELTHDYMGKVKSFFCNRKWHFGKCSPDSPWNHKKYEGPIFPFCMGGHGYILSRLAATTIASHLNYENDIFEDVCVAKILRSQNIRPVKIPHLKLWFESPEHRYTWI